MAREPHGISLLARYVRDDGFTGPLQRRSHSEQPNLTPLPCDRGDDTRNQPNRDNPTRRSDRTERGVYPATNYPQRLKWQRIMGAGAAVDHDRCHDRGYDVVRVEVVADV